MPEIVDELPEDVTYPWVEWMDGQIRRFTRGEDFECAPRTFVRLARRAGWRQRRRVYARVDAKQGIVVLQFLAPTPEDLAK